MTKRFILPALCCLLLPACTQTVRITEVADLPLKTTRIPSTDWKVSPLRANAQYILYDAHSSVEQKRRIGDYYFVSWYDAEPQKPVKIVMHYTQPRTGSQILTSVIEYKQPRSSSGHRKEKFFFVDKERARNGDILSWKIELYCDGELKDTRQSYLWE